MKVLVITKTKSGGGTEGHINSIIPALRKRDIDIEAAYTEDGFWQLYRHIYTWRPDIVHFFLPRPYLLGSIACELALQNKRIMSRRSLTDSYQTPLIRFIEKLLHRRTTVLVGNSHAVIDQLLEEAPKADIMIIRNGVTIKPVLPIGSATFLMICVANAFEYKGHQDLIAAIRRIAPSLPEPWQLLLVGRGTEKFNGDWRIKGLGYRTDIPELLACASLFILPSHEEGCSNALLEAMACGVPVIATDVGGNNDAIPHDGIGILVPPKSPEKLAAAILRMAGNPDYRKVCAQSALKLVNERFSFSRCIDAYESLYYSTLKGA